MKTKLLHRLRRQADRYYKVIKYKTPEKRNRFAVLVHYQGEWRVVKIAGTLKRAEDICLEYKRRFIWHSINIMRKK